jgi:hypothetical protein
VLLLEIVESKPRKVYVEDRSTILRTFLAVAGNVLLSSGLFVGFSCLLGLVWKFNPPTLGRLAPGGRSNVVVIMLSSIGLANLAYSAGLSVVLGIGLIFFANLLPTISIRKK